MATIGPTTAAGHMLWQGSWRRTTARIGSFAAVGLLPTSGLFAQIGPAPPQPPASAAKTGSAPRDVWQHLRELSPGDVLVWLRAHGLTVLLILLIATIILWLANRLHNRFVRILAAGMGRESPPEQEKRAKTLVGVAHNTLRTVVIAAAAIMILEEVGVPIGPLLGGVAVVGLAVAFGAQSLIKDYFTGFLVLLEQQYMIGDVVKIGAITGQVEKITLRLTVLRDVEGSVHFIPHGQISFVSNLTHGWSQVVFDLHVNSGEPVERIRDLFFELVAELRGDPKYQPMILNDPDMLGVDAISDATYTLKFSLRTLPLKRWEVKRELLRRLKDRFQKLQLKVTVPA